jgi:hypothetical protein
MTTGSSNATAQARTAPPALPRLGINLAGAVDWNTELPFVDVYRHSRDWISQQPQGGWGNGPKLSFDEAGNIKALEPGHFADSVVLSSNDAPYPTGTYTLLWQGDGELDVWGGARVTNTGSSRASVELLPGRGPVFVRLKRTNPTNPVRNIRLLRPGTPADAPLNAFHDDFLNRWRGVSCVRFMDWQRTNNSQQSRWADRAKPTDVRYGDRGVAIEVMVDLANKLGADPWFCIPHLADDEYATRFAELVKEKLDPRRKVYVELSNELWNAQFEQARHLAQAAKAGNGNVPALVAERSLKLFRQWERVFGGNERLVRVVPSQAVNSWISDQILKTGDLLKHADVLAIAPYMPMDVAPSGNGLTVAKVEGWSVEQFLDHIEKVGLPECAGWIRAQKVIADKAGLRLVAYEGGQHGVGILGAENNEKLTRLLHAANAHPRMGQLYERYLDNWAALGGDLMCHFNSVEAWTKWGSWGLLRHGQEDASKSPKFMATMRWARKHGQPVRVPGG